MKRIRLLSVAVAILVVITACETQPPLPLTGFVMTTANRNLTIAQIADVGVFEAGITVPVSPILRVGQTRQSVFQEFGTPDVIFYGNENSYDVTTTDANAYHIYRDDELSFLIWDNRVISISLLGQTWMCSNGLTADITLAEAEAILGTNYSVTETQFKDFIDYHDLGIALELYHESGLVQEVEIKEENRN